MATDTDFHALPITALSREPGDALVVTFEIPPSLTSVFAFKPGQHIAIRALIDGAEQRRNYSICAGPGEPLRVAVKRVEGGIFSTWAHAALRVGMTLDVMPPVGRFVLPPSNGTQRQIVAIAAGSGITPILGLTRQALLHDMSTHVTLVYANRTRDTVMFGEELEALKDKQLGRFEIVPVFSRAGEVESPLLEGRIDGDKVKSLGDTLIRFQSAERIYLCGPGDMIKSCRNALLELGVKPDAIAHEFFAPPSAQRRKPPAHPEAGKHVTSGRNVTVILDGVRHLLDLAPGETVLQAALRTGVKAPYSCAGGMCSTCRARIVEGSADMLLNYSLEPWEIAKGFTLACQAIPTSDTLVIDWDAM